MTVRLVLLSALLGVGMALWWLAQPAAPARDRPIPPLPPASPEAPLKLVAFGTSLTRGYHWPDGLAARLQACLRRPVQITRIARDGAGTDWALGQIDKVAAADPDIVLIEFAANDADLRDGKSPSRARGDLDHLLKTLRTRLPAARPVLMTMNPVTGPHRLLRIRLGRHHDVYAGLAARHDTGFANLNARWKAAPLARHRPPDGLHPQDDAATALVVPVLAALIAPAAGGACPP